ncbi:MAG TPA: nucleoside hydrolase [Verrucomicrobiota bacterium]|nr:nucleoside hydrolase [Verrucomicrobiota bacterium]HNU49547.1 nucleoside hydrolase [Verrucomicrobiota bacterium]
MSRRCQRRVFLKATGLCALASGLGLGCRTAPPDKPAKARETSTPSVPVLYCSDLFHPHVDPDDHFDLATLHGLDRVNIAGIVLDQGQRQLERPGRIPVSQLHHLTDRNIPTAIGLATPLRGPTDPALDQAPRFQAGTQLILDTLRQSRQPVSIIAVGSVRDVVAAFNREPDLFRRRVARILVFIGEATREDHREYNVGLDPHAYVGLLRSGLPIDWVPCFDGGPWQNRGHASFWQATHRQLLEHAPDPLVQYFLYALDHERGDPIAALARPVDPARRDRLFAGQRNLWCTAVFAWVTGRTVVRTGTDYRLAPPPAGPSPDPETPAPLFGFEPIEVSVDDHAVVRYGGPNTRCVRRFVVLDPARYAEGMTRVTAALLAQFPIRNAPRTPSVAGSR